MSSLSSRRDLHIEIAGLGVHLTGLDEQLRGEIVARYAGFLGGNGQADMSVQLDLRTSESPSGFLEPELVFQQNEWKLRSASLRGRIHFSRRSGRLIIPAAGALAALDYYLRVVYAWLSLEAGGLMLHAAGILHKGAGYVFLGQSGAGKTTLARISHPRIVLNDDLIVLQPLQGHWQVHGTPFWNPTQVKPSCRQGPLAAVYSLIQNQSVSVQPLSPASAVSALIACSPVLPADPRFAGRVLSRCQQICETIPVRQLHFRKDDSFWQMVAQMN